MVEFSKHVELHSFSDACKKAYRGVVYIRCFMKNRGNFVNLLCSKFRVALLKRISLSSLEISGAVSMTNFMQKVSMALPITFNDKVYWTDSTITMSWLKAEPSSWKTFVAIRVSEIQNVSDIMNCHHVQGKDADPSSRGVLPGDLLECDLWWRGPQFLMTKKILGFIKILILI